MMMLPSRLKYTVYCALNCPDFGRIWLFMALLFCGTNVHAEDSLLHIKPARCIALHEGQVCYQKLKINWRVAAVDTYCLYQQGNNEPLLCWVNKTDGAGIYEFVGNKSSTFLLVRKSDAQVVAQMNIDVAWVYDSSSHRESHWRIF